MPSRIASSYYLLCIIKIIALEIRRSVFYKLSAVCILVYYYFLYARVKHRVKLLAAHRLLRLELEILRRIVEACHVLRGDIRILIYYLMLIFGALRAVLPR